MGHPGLGVRVLHRLRAGCPLAVRPIPPDLRAAKSSVLDDTRGSCSRLVVDEPPSSRSRRVGSAHGTSQLVDDVGSGGTPATRLRVSRRTLRARAARGIFRTLALSQSLQPAACKSSAYRSRRLAGGLAPALALQLLFENVASPVSRPRVIASFSRCPSQLREPHRRTALRADARRWAGHRTMLCDIEDFAHFESADISIPDRERSFACAARVVLWESLRQYLRRSTFVSISE